MCGCADTHTQSMWSILKRDFEWKCLNVKLMKTLWLPAENTTAMEYEQGIYVVKSYFKIFFPVLPYSAVHTLDLFQLKTSIIILHIIYFVLISKHNCLLKPQKYSVCFRSLKLSNSFYHLLEWTGFFGGSSGVIVF